MSSGFCPEIKCYGSNSIEYLDQTVLPSDLFQMIGSTEEMETHKSVGIVSS